MHLQLLPRPKSDWRLDHNHRCKHDLRGQEANFRPWFQASCPKHLLKKQTKFRILKHIHYNFLINTVEPCFLTSAWLLKNQCQNFWNTKNGTSKLVSNNVMKTNFISEVIFPRVNKINFAMFSSEPYFYHDFLERKSKNIL